MCLASLHAQDSEDWPDLLLLIFPRLETKNKKKESVVYVRLDFVSSVLLLLCKDIVFI